MNMKKIILEGSQFTDILTTHKILKEIFEFPDYYGNNLDAFWDCITDWYVGEKAKIIWKDFDTSKNNLGEKADALLELFQEAEKEYGDFTIEVIP